MRRTRFEETNDSSEIHLQACRTRDHTWLSSIISRPGAVAQERLSLRPADAPPSALCGPGPLSPHLQNGDKERPHCRPVVKTE